MGNELNIDLENKFIILTDDFIYYKENELLIGTPEERVFLCIGGFGCRSYTMGSLISGVLITQNFKFAIHGIGGSIERLATEQEIEKAKELHKKFENSEQN